MGLDVDDDDNALRASRRNSFHLELIFFSHPYANSRCDSPNEKCGKCRTITGKFHSLINCFVTFKLKYLNFQAGRAARLMNGIFPFSNSILLIRQTHHEQHFPQFFTIFICYNFASKKTFARLQEQLQLLMAGKKKIRKGLEGKNVRVKRIMEWSFIWKFRTEKKSSQNLESFFFFLRKFFLSKKGRVVKKYFCRL